jgi:two-component system, cell cycle sensor histidine kinase and response regulator CckA
MKNPTTLPATDSSSASMPWARNPAETALRRLSRWVLGPDFETLGLEQRLFTWVLLLSTLACVVALVENGLLRFPPLLQAGTAAISILFTIFFILVRRGVPYRTLVYPTVGTLLSFLAEVWFFNSGSIGGSQFYLLIAVLPIVVFTRGPGRAFVMGAYVVLVVTLYILEQTNPGLIARYPSESARIIDVAVSFFSVMILMICFAIVLHNGYQEAMKKVSAEKAESDARFFETADLLPVMICEAGRDLAISFVNRAGGELTGYAPGELARGRTALDLIHPDDRERARDRFTHALSGEHVPLGEYRVLRKDGTVIKMLLQCGHAWTKKTVSGLRMCLVDITEQKSLEEQFRQSQKMESVGLLAGGVAHDFNNIMSAVMGYADLIRKENRERGGAGFDRKLDEQAAAILQAGDRAADLVRKLLAFSRQGSYQEKPVNMHLLIDDVAALLSHSIDKRITIAKTLTALNPMVSGDQALLQSALLNLAVNARDAMPDGGMLSFSTSCVVVDERSADKRAFGVAPGNYVSLTVADTGIGLGDEAKKHLFEPFFTTKEPGKGTGLGLASVFGTIKRHGGFIKATSEKGRGTAMTFCLPQAAVPAVAEAPAPKEARASRPLHVLVVDDEAMICDFVKEFLESQGHRASTFTNPREAVEWYKTAYDGVDCVLLDMNMPEMDGKSCLAALRRINPAAKALFSTGFMVGDTSAIIRMPGVKGYVQKPFSLDALMQSIVQAVEGESA